MLLSIYKIGRGLYNFCSDIKYILFFIKKAMFFVLRLSWDYFKIKSQNKVEE